MKDNTLDVVQARDSIPEFLLLVRRSCSDLESAAMMLSRLAEADPEIINKILEAEPTVPRGFLNRLMKVAEKSLAPELLLNNCWAYRRISSLPFSTQRKIIDQKAVEFVVGEADKDVVRVQIVDLDRKQLAQVMGESGLRSRDEQRAWLRRQPAPVTNIPQAVSAFHTRKDTLYVTAPTQFTRKDLIRILEDMEG